VQGSVLKEICRVRLQFIHYDLVFMVNMFQLEKYITHVKKIKGITTKKTRRTLNSVKIRIFNAIFLHTCRIVRVHKMQ